MIAALYRLVGILFFFCLFQFAAVAERVQPTQAFITVADIHFDPFAACKRAPRPCAILKKLRAADYQQWDTILAASSDKAAGVGSDTNYPLLQSMLHALEKANQQDKPQFVLVLGDFLAHRFRKNYITYSEDHSSIGYTQFVSKTLQFLTYRLNQTFPHISVYPVMGNNDTYTANYDVVPNGAFLSETAKTWSLLIKDKENRKRFLNVFPRCGYYAILLPHHQKILVLNTVLFSPRSHKKKMAIAAEGQIHWLTDELSSLQQEHAHAILAFHIPPHVNFFTSLKFAFISIETFWQAKYNKAFENILQLYPATIAAILPAHIHLDVGQLVLATSIPVIFTPSISPIYGNKPSFKVMRYRPDTLHIENSLTYPE